MPTSAVDRCTVSYMESGLLATIQSRVRLEGIHLKVFRWLFLGASSDSQVVSEQGTRTLSPYARCRRQNHGAGSPTTREGSLRMKNFKDFPGISKKAAYWKIMKFS